MKKLKPIIVVMAIVLLQACVAQNYDGLKMYKCNPNKTVTLGTPAELKFFFNRKITDDLSVNLNAGDSEVSYEVAGEEITVTITPKTVGVKTVTGNIQLKKGDKVIKEFAVNEEIFVREPNTLVINTDSNNKLKLNQANKLQISVEGIPPHKLEVSTDNGEIIKQGVNFVITPNKKGACKVFISGQQVNGNTYKTEYQFVVE